MSIYSFLKMNFILKFVNYPLIRDVITLRTRVPPVTAGWLVGRLSPNYLFVVSNCHVALLEPIIRNGNHSRFTFKLNGEIEFPKTSGLTDWVSTEFSQGRTWLSKTRLSAISIGRGQRIVLIKSKLTYCCSLHRLPMAQPDFREISFVSSDFYVYLSSQVTNQKRMERFGILF